MFHVGEHHVGDKSARHRIAVGEMTACLKGESFHGVGHGVSEVESLAESVLVGVGLNHALLYRHAF